MEALFTKLLDLIERWISYFLPFAILPDGHCGFVRRLGRYRRLLRHGLNLKWPIVEYPESVSSALETTVLREQSLTARDNVQVTVRGVLCWRVSHVRTYMIDCANASDVVADVGCAVIAELVPRLSSTDVLHSDTLAADLLRAMRRRGKKWGVYVESCGLVDRVAAPTYRIISGGSTHAGVQE